MRNTLWLVGVAVPLRVLFAFGIALLLTRARRGIGFFRTVFYLPALAPPVAATLGFVFLLNPGPARSTRPRPWSGIEGPLWFNDRRPGRSRRCRCSALWGVGDLMVIFLAALLDVPRQLYEAAELDGAAAWQRFRYVTLPTICPVILFAVVTGVIEALQYFTQAYVAGTIAAGWPSQAGDASNAARLPARTRRSSIPSCSTSTASATSTWATPRRWRCCCSSSRSRSRCIIIRTRAAGCTTRGGRCDDRARPHRRSAAPLARRSRPPHGAAGASSSRSPSTAC